MKNATYAVVVKDRDGAPVYVLTSGAIRPYAEALAEAFNAEPKRGEVEGMTAAVIPQLR